LFKNLCVCIIAILFYHIFIKRLILPKIRLAKSKCKNCIEDDRSELLK